MRPKIERGYEITNKRGVREFGVGLDSADVRLMVGKHTVFLILAARIDHIIRKPADGAGGEQEVRRREEVGALCRPLLDLILAAQSHVHTRSLMMELQCSKSLDDYQATGDNLAPDLFEQREEGSSTVLKRVYIAVHAKPSEILKQDGSESE